MRPDDKPLDLARNRHLWSLVNAQFTDDDAEAMWAAPEISWGLFRIPERDLGLLGDVTGAAVVELGCGTAYLSAWLDRAGARPVAVDLSPDQLDTARRCQRRTGRSFPLVEANGEQVPLRSGAFDLVISEYGAGPWCDPKRWLPEAARLLKPGGRLIFLTNSVLAGLCVPADEGFAGERLLRPQRDLYPIAWVDGGVEFHPGHGDWIRELRAAGFVVDALHELYPPEDAPTHEYYDIVTAEWASRWPAEDLWVAHLAG
ncbi:class I SAM-dependent methyltransferase [Aquihabitans sp. McL0605]|uniref:class I SAM-dependent methyltransferase n=1 Tax=Aquihabitans sp. McL0605 TaxID=3415671 RepID=UPI003CF43AD0